MLINLTTFIILLASFIALAVLFFIINKKIVKNQLKFSFTLTISCLLICDIGLIAQALLAKPLNIPPIYFDYFAYIGNCFLPLALLFTSIIFIKTKIEFKRKYLLLFILPIVSLLILWTNNYHHLFYKKYSIYSNETIFGPYMNIYLLYSYCLFCISLINFIRYTRKTTGFFSKQSFLIIIGTIIYIIINFVAFSGLFKSTIYITPITSIFTIICYAIAIFKFKFLSITPITLQIIVDKISDGFIVINERKKIIDFNQTFLNMFKVKENDIRNVDILKTINQFELINSTELNNILTSIECSDTTFEVDKYFSKLNKHFHIEFSRLTNNQTFLGTLILFKDITQHTKDMQTIKNNQESLMESERLASLGQLIGRIAHNLKTPIMSISGAAEGLSDLVREYDMSIGNPQVTNEDHHAIADDMNTWIVKIKNYTEYMSDIITTVKGQAVKLSETNYVSFDLEELIKRINILMRDELNTSGIHLNIRMHTDSKTLITGDINSLIQVINNIISNAIQAYNGKTEQTIELEFSSTKNNLIISVTDYGCGISPKIKDKLFKEMITTKGQHGTGLGLYMSYSTIKANFNGNITFESEEGKGTTFNIILPI